MPLIYLAPAAVAIALSFGSGAVLLVVSIVNAVLLFFAINTMLNLGTQRDTGEMTDTCERDKSISMAG